MNVEEKQKQVTVDEKDQELPLEDFKQQINLDPVDSQKDNEALNIPIWEPV